MTLTLRKNHNGKHCHACGQPLEGKYCGEVGVMLTIFLCSQCAYENRERIHALPFSLELKHKALASPLMLDNKQGG